VLIDIVAGARPNFMKIAPIIRALEARREEGGELRYRLVHTGQHYDRSMSGDFFSQLGIPDPDVNLEVGSGTQGEQTAAILTRYEKLLLASPSNCCVVVGDVTSTIACAISSQKLAIPVAHVEGGIRSGDWTMPEEINRLLTDAITNWFFTTSQFANENLRRSGVADDRIFYVGNTMIDTLLANYRRLTQPAFWGELKLQARNYFVLTLHRPVNVDDEPRLASWLRAIGSGVRGLPVVFPVHPRTTKTLETLTDLAPNIHFVEPQPYLEFNYLVQNCKAVITDSGGVTEEATVMGIPCMTLRDTTERPETVTQGTNELLGTDPAALPAAFERLFAEKWKSGSIPDLWDGKSAGRIVLALEQLLLRA